MLARLLERIQAPPVQDEPGATVELAAAVLLVEVACADHQMSAAETAAMERALSSTFSLSDEDVKALLAQSREEHRDSVGLHRFTRTIVEAWPLERRFDLVVQLWRLAYSDAELDKHEEAAIRKAADLLYVDHRRFIAAKLKAKQLAAAPWAPLPPPPERPPSP